MLKRDITYEDFDGKSVTETFYFNISKPELIEMEVEYKEGFDKYLEKVIQADDKKELMAVFKRIVLLSYGQKSDDGKRFIKNDELRKDFEQTAAYISLFTELALDDDAAAKFINGVLPRDIVEGKKEAEKPAPASE